MTITDREGASIVIVGGGFSGTMVAAHLLSQERVPLQITLIEPRKEVGLGLAYSTHCPEHLLNVPAGKMSALPKEPDHFLNYAQKVDKTVTTDTYVPRITFGRYIQSILANRVEHTKISSYKHVSDEVIDLGKASGQKKILVSLKSGASLLGDYVVLATGNTPCHSPVKLGLESLPESVYLADPWQLDADFPKQDSAVLLIGTGLTAVDKVIELLRNHHTGKIYAVSRHGYLPFSQLDGPMAPTVKLDKIPKHLVKSMHELKKLAGSLPDWRSAVDSCRPVTQAWWAGLSLQEKSAFFKHVQSIWDVHRHRMASQIAHKIYQAMEHKQFEILAGRIISADLEDGGIKVSVRKRHDHSVATMHVSKIINCTGFKVDFERTKSALLKTLAKQELLRPHVLKCGIESNELGQVLGKDEFLSQRIFAVGPMLRPQYFETVAVPELREQAENMAKTILSCLSVAPVS
jgi:uncharacterized NAD(P)/FAD-binding protein YdhS